MTAKSAWIFRDGRMPIYTADIGIDDPCDGWPIEKSVGRYYVTYDWEVVLDIKSREIFGWSARVREFS